MKQLVSRPQQLDRRCVAAVLRGGLPRRCVGAIRHIGVAAEVGSDGDIGPSPLTLFEVVGGIILSPPPSPFWHAKKAMRYTSRFCTAN